MTRTKISIYLALIFIAGAIAGGAVVMSSPETFAMRRHSPRPPHGSPEDFANHVWNRLKERLRLTDDQVAKIEPVFRAGFSEVRAIQDKSLEEVEAAIRKNHAEISAFLSDEQKAELQKMNEERQDFLKHREHRPPPPPGKASVQKSLVQ
jgi:Spy/CpxP family protein refolding chaperone